MSLSSVSQFRNNQPAFGCKTCNAARKILLRHGAPRKAIDQYVAFRAPADGKYAPHTLSLKLWRFVITKEIKKHMPHSHWAKKLLDTVKQNTDLLVTHLKMQ